MKDKIIEILRGHEQTFVYTDSEGLPHPFRGLHNIFYNDMADAIHSVYASQPAASEEEIRAKIHSEIHKMLFDAAGFEEEGE